MKILYLSPRINAPDGSSVHGRAFVASVAKLGHAIRAHPEPARLREVSCGANAQERGPAYYLAKMNWKTAKRQMRKVHRYVGELIDLAEGIRESRAELEKVKEIVASYHPDVIVCRHSMFHFTPFWIRRLYDIPCVLEVNAIRSMETVVLDGKKKVSPLTTYFENFAIRNSDYFVCVSSFVKEYVDRQVAATRSAVVYNGVDTESFDPQHFDGARVKRELGLQGKIVLGYVGSYKGWHGLGTTIDVMDLLRKNSSNYHLLLIGTGATYRQVQEKIASKGLQSAVTQLGPIPHEEAPRYLVAFDYALMTYPALGQFYFSPLKMFEYLAMGIPVVATAVGQIKEVIQHGETGFLVDPPTPENFASAVAMAEDDPEARERIGKNGRRLVVERYGWKANAAQVIAVCERAIADRKQTLRESPSSR